jgi:hypothetical protein
LHALAGIRRTAALVAVCLLALSQGPAPESLASPAQHFARAAACAPDTAAVRQLAQIFNSRDDGFQCLGITIAGQAIAAIRFETHASSQRAGTAAVRVSEFPVSLIESRDGAVLDGTPGHFTRPSTSADLVIRYLYNGFTSEYHQCAVTIDQGADADWHLVNALHQTVTRIFVRTWALPLIGTAGIADLEGACDRA